MRERAHQPCPDCRVHLAQAAIRLAVSGRWFSRAADLVRRMVLRRSLRRDMWCVGRDDLLRYCMGRSLRQRAGGNLDRHLQSHLQETLSRLFRTESTLPWEPELDTGMSTFFQSKDLLLADQVHSDQLLSFEELCFCFDLLLSSYEVLGMDGRNGIMFTVAKRNGASQCFVYNCELLTTLRTKRRGLAVGRAFQRCNPNFRLKCNIEQIFTNVKLAVKTHQI
jgi:hypothetical protein